MAAPKYSLAAVVLLSACAVADPAPDVDIENKLAACVAISSHTLLQQGEMPVLEMQLQQHAPTAECGCKSAISRYRSDQVIDGQPSPLLAGDFTFMGRQTLRLPLAVQQQLIAEGGRVRLQIGCASPD